MRERLHQGFHSCLKGLPARGLRIPPLTRKSSGSSCRICGISRLWRTLQRAVVAFMPPLAGRRDESRRGTLKRAPQALRRNSSDLHPHGWPAGPWRPPDGRGSVPASEPALLFVLRHRRVRRANGHVEHLKIGCLQYLCRRLSATSLVEQEQRAPRDQVHASGPEIKLHRGFLLA